MHPAYISPYLAYTSPISRLHLAHISPVSPQELARERAQLQRAQTIESLRAPCLEPIAGEI